MIDSNEYFRLNNLMNVVRVKESLVSKMVCKLMYMNWKKKSFKIWNPLKPAYEGTMDFAFLIISTTHNVINLFTM